MRTMITLLLTVAVMLTVAVQSEAQVQEVWRWSNTSTMPIFQTGLSTINDNGNVLSARTSGFNGSFQVRAAMLSSDGLLLWNKSWDYNKTGKILALNSDPHGAVYSVGRSATTDDSVMFSKHDANGVMIWNTVTTVDNSTAIKSGRVTSNGTMFAGLVKQNVVGPPDYNCIKANEIGSCNWYSSSGFGPSNYVSPSTGIKINNSYLWGEFTDNSGFVYLENWVSKDLCFNWTNCERDCNTMLDSLYLFKLTSAGTLIYSKKGLSEHTAFAVTSTGNLYMTKAGATLNKYDQQGVVLWTSSLPANTAWHEIMIDPSEKTVIVFSNADNSNGYYISSFNSNGALQWMINGPNANYANTKKCLDDKGNLYLSNAPYKTIDRINNNTGVHDWTYSADVSRIYQMKAITGGDLIVIRSDHIQRLTPTTTLTLLDANKDALSNKEFYLIRVADDAPLFTPDTLGVVRTDADGKIKLTPVP